VNPTLPCLLFESMRTNAQRALLDAMGPDGYWEGQLSSSALSTATATIALDNYQRTRTGLPSDEIATIHDLIAGGRRWLRDNQNGDGGWGDTVKSHSNISTTLLCWGAIHRAAQDFEDCNRRATHWIEQHAGGITPKVLAPAIRKRYGKDQTFSVPILTALAITGRLGETQQGWTWVPQLPFELAAFPKRMFAAMRLPVVSYALPALIAIGLVKHRKAPSWNPAIRAMRNAVTHRTLKVLRSIQPTTGGFLEATPLTSFVSMSLIDAGYADHEVVRHGIEFLVRSVRADGSWPIDTHLATWVSTLAINAMSHEDEFAEQIGEPGVHQLREWLLGQQYSARHPYTDAEPGGWAWTPLSGGVPDADDTPGALLALDGFDRVCPHTAIENARCAERGIRWLIGLQNRDGGIPTFCRGWGTLPFDRSNPDITAHAIRAMICWRDRLPRSLHAKIDGALRSAAAFLARNQEASGAWTPLWFGNQLAGDESNRTYGTSRVLMATLSLIGHPAELPRSQLLAGLRWILLARNADGGWGGEENTPSSIEETALAIETLSACIHAQRTENLWSIRDVEEMSHAIRSGLAWLHTATDAGRSFPATPIGFYFAKLWYFEQMYPIVYTVAAVNRTHMIVPEIFPEESSRNS
jgi:squalene-hopene/tetraprenyl-beta-curcumene cyclase